MCIANKIVVNKTPIDYVFLATAVFPSGNLTTSYLTSYTMIDEK